MKTLTVVLIVLSTSLAGCASIFNTAGESELSCPGMPQGVICKTPMAVFKSTNKMPASVDSDRPFGMSVEQPKGQQTAVPAEQAMAAPVTGVPGAVRALPRPVREPAKVMRIWIAPWIDRNDDLHYPSYLFTEVEPRRWTIGKPEFAGKGVTIPHKALSQTAPVPTSENSTEAHSRGAPRRVGGDADPVPMDVTLE